MNARDEEPPCTPPRTTGIAGAGGSESDGQMDSDNESDEELQASKKRRKWFGRREFTLIKLWVTTVTSGTLDRILEKNRV
jgi:hypothetical protein